MLTIMLTEANNIGSLFRTSADSGEQCILKSQSVQQ